MSSVDTLLEANTTSLTLYRFPRRRNETLQAWDGADRYFLHERLARYRAPLLVVNDDFGALALMAGEGAYSWSDSWLAQHNWHENGRVNQQRTNDAYWRWPFAPLPEAGEVWLKVPKELALLTQQLHRLTSELPAGTPIYLAWLDKHIPASLVELARTYLSDVELMRGRFKAHGLRGLSHGAAPQPLPYPSSIEVPQLPQPLLCHAGVFAQHRLDIGSRFMLEHLPSGHAGTLVDLACGSGVLGLVAAQKNPAAQCWFADASWLAIQSAKENWQRLYPQREAYFWHGNGLVGWQGEADLVLLNPPFHTGHTVDGKMAAAMFRQVANKLAGDGECWVVGNRHLGYEKLLKRHFADVQQVGEHPKFTLFCARSAKKN